MNCFRDLISSSPLKGEHSANERGGALLESALSIPVLFAILLGTFYIGFHLSARSLVFNGITSALDLAVTHPGLEADYQETCPEGSNQSGYCGALYDIRQEALAMATSSLVGKNSGGFAYCDTESPETLVITIPEATATLSRNQARLENPIGISLTCYFRGMDLQFHPETLRAYAFYEIPKTGKYPVKVDCHGNPEGHDEYNLKPCECDIDGGESSVWNGAQWDCFKCSNDAPLSSPTKDDGLHYSTKDEHGCYCPSTTYCQQDYRKNNPSRPGYKGYVSFTGGCPYNSNCCKCACYTEFGYKTDADTGDCICKDGPTGAYPTSSNADTSTVPAAVFESARSMSADGRDCECVVANSQSKVGSSGIPDSYLSGGKITSALCRAWFPDLVAAGWNPGVRIENCSCQCNGCSNGSKTGNWWGGGGGPSGCGCNCGANKELLPDKSACVCSSAPCAGGLDREAWPSCKCPLYCADPNQVPNGDGTQCVCKCTGELPNPTCPDVATYCAGGGSTGG